MHDRTLACRYADHLVALHQGRIAAMGTAHEVITTGPPQLGSGMAAAVIDDPVFMTSTVIPIGRRHCVPAPE